MVIIISIILLAGYLKLLKYLCDLEIQKSLEKQQKILDIHKEIWEIQKNSKPAE